MGSAQKRNIRITFPPISLTTATDLREYATKNVGAFPRDPMDRRLFSPIVQNAVNTQPINGTDYFNDAFQLDFTTQPLAPTDTDNDGMPDTWETANGLNPNSQDHNGTQLSKKFTGVEGYTNLECYLNELSDKLVGSASIIISPPSTTILGIELNSSERFSASISPNPTDTGVKIKVNGQIENSWRFELVDALGRVITEENNISSPEKTFCCPG